MLATLISVYGTVIVRDRLDFKCVNIFRRDRINCQHISSEVFEGMNEDLILAGPTRGLFYTGEAFFEINLKIKEDEECNDRQFTKALIDVLLARSPKVSTRTVPGRLSEVQLVCAYVKNALEGTFEMKIRSGPEVFCGNRTACTTDVPNNIILYDSDVGGGMAVADDGIIQLFRRVVAVSEHEILILNIDARGSDLNVNISRCISMFTPRIKGADAEEVTCGLYKIRVEVTWSTVHVPFE